MIKDNDKTIEKLVAKKGVHSGHRERMREKVHIDPEMRTFADHEMLEFQLSLVIPRRDTNKLAHDLINTFGSLDAVYRAAPSELIRVKGMTVSAAYLIGTQMAVMRRTLKYSNVESRDTELSRPNEAIAYMNTLYAGRNTEMFAVCLLDSRYRVVRTACYDSASPSGVNVNIEDVVLMALREGVSYAIIAHNHPSGDVSPSPDDVMFTKRILSALIMSGISLVDHVIFYEDKMFSFKNSGIIDRFMDEMYESVGNTKMKDFKRERQVFLAGLQEYILDPMQFKNGVFSARPRSEIVQEYVTKMENDYKRAEEKQKSDEHKITKKIEYPDVF